MPPLDKVRFIGQIVDPAKQAFCEMFSKYTVNSLLEELDCIELLRASGHNPIIREMLTKQTAIYDAMDVPQPDMGW